MAGLGPGAHFRSALLLAFGGAMLIGLMRRPFDRVVGNSLILLATIPAFRVLLGHRAGGRRAAHLDRCVERRVQRRAGTGAHH